MLSAIAKLFVRRTVGQINAANVDAVMKGYRADAVITFPGDHSWGRTYRGTEQIRAFFERAARTGLQFDVDEVVAKGFPWDMTLAFQLRDRVEGPDGTVVYANRVAEFLNVSWGKVRRQEVYLDTQKVAALDEHLAAAKTA